MKKLIYLLLFVIIIFKIYPDNQYVTEIDLTKYKDIPNHSIIVSWNLENFGDKKSDETIQFMANTLRNADIVGVQEVSTSDKGAQAVARLANALNETGAKWDYIISDSTKGEGRERYAFFWKTKIFVNHSDANLINELDQYIDREPYKVTFKLNNEKELSIYTIHTVPTKKIPLNEIKAFLRIKDVLNQGNNIIMGDFNLSNKAIDPVFKNQLGYSPTIFNKTTFKSKLGQNGSYYASAYDNIYFKGEEITIVDKGIIDFYSQFNSLQEVKKISDHMPVFIVIEIK